MTMRITQQKPNALPGGKYGSFRHPFFIPKLFRLVATRSALWALVADRQIIFRLVADKRGLFVLEA
jgi:hypothetical protein